MAIGPRDKRLIRSRCLACIARHVKCSGDTPCAHCRRSFRICEYASALAKPILLDNPPISSRTQLTIPQLPACSENDGFFQFFFSDFAPRNQFSGRTSEWHQYLYTRLPVCRGHFCTVAALGALLTSSREGRTKISASVLQKAVRWYQKGVKHLESWIYKDRSQWDALPMLSMAFLLSLFELMYDTSGIGWNAHMGFGTSVLLQLMGPTSFKSPQSIAIYREIRLFEISRAALFSQHTILATPQWLLYDQECCNASRGFIEKAFDLLLQCQIFGQRAIDYSKTHAYLKTKATSPDIAEAACSLKSQLDHFSCELAATSVSSETSVAWIYYHAMSIYLSGLFDYVLSETSCDISLTGGEVRFHTAGILSRSKKVLGECSVSSLLLLLPLRIAGNRCNTPTEVREVANQLDKIERVFAITLAFRRELQHIWYTRAEHP